MWDIIIAGAGPAGTVAATLLARAGARVLIVDRAKFPRDKLCGDSVNPGTLGLLRRLNLGASIEAHGLPLDGMRVCGPSGIEVPAVYPGSLRGHTMVRRDLDQGLLDEAIRSGAQFEDGVVVRRPLLRSHGSEGTAVGGILVTRRGTLETPLYARVTIAADGRRSKLASAMNLSMYPDRPRRWAIGAYFEGVSGCMSMGEMHIRPGEYVGVAPLAGGLTNICAVGTPAILGSVSDPNRALRAAMDRIGTLRDRSADARLVAGPAVLGPLAVDARAAGVPGLLLAGDAAGFIDPMTGDGLRFAVEGGMLAAEAALETLATGNPDAHVRLARRRREAFGAKRRFNRVLRRVVDSAAVIRIAAFGASLVPAYVDALVAIAGDCGRLDRSLPDGSHRCHVDRSASAYPHAE